MINKILSYLVYMSTTFFWVKALYTFYLGGVPVSGLLSVICVAIGTFIMGYDLSSYVANKQIKKYFDTH